MHCVYRFESHSRMEMKSQPSTRCRPWGIFSSWRVSRTVTSGQRAPVTWRNCRACDIFFIVLLNTKRLRRVLRDFYVIFQFAFWCTESQSTHLYIVVSIFSRSLQWSGFWMNWFVLHREVHLSHSFVQWTLEKADVDGILPKGSYPPCLRMADRALLAGYPRRLGLLLLGSLARPASV